MNNRRCHCTDYLKIILTSPARHKIKKKTALSIVWRRRDCLPGKLRGSPDPRWITCARGAAEGKTDAWAAAPHAPTPTPGRQGRGRKPWSRARANLRAPFPRGWEPRHRRRRRGDQEVRAPNLINKVTPARRPVLKLYEIIPVLSRKKKQEARSNNILNGAGLTFYQ